MCLFLYQKNSIAELVEKINRKLWQVLDKEITETESFRLAVQDIENQLIKRRDEIFGTSASNSNAGADDKDEDAFARQKFSADVNEQ